jgi:diaminohydroxyphosphoribosylaminopyrimidine deaminase / 5-amino-6-(5-phosphoribosylamino)uracil reductase
MQRCIELARKGEGQVFPNPMVGCVIVYGDTVIAEGYHEKYGGPHAEVNAIRAVKDKSLLEKATMYVNLEPCAHHGKTPPCADLIVENKLKEVVIGSLDSNELVAGKGVSLLKNAGITVRTGVLEKESYELNRRFFTFHGKKRPYVILKWAQTEDGFIDAERSADAGKTPLQVSGQDAKVIVHKWRSEEEAIMVGTNTVLMDNPRLTVRETSGRNPLRVTVDKWLRIPKTFHILDKTTATLVFTSTPESSETNLEYVKINFNADIIGQVLAELYRRNIHSLLVEGGEQLLNSFIESGRWDEARVIVAPQKVLRGVKAPLLGQKEFKKEKAGSDRISYFKNSVPD